MFYYVEDKAFLRRARSFCSDLVKKVETECRQCGLNGQIFILGSGARNMVTQNEHGAIDFDYNLNIISCADWDDGRTIKETVRKNFNKVMRSFKLGDVQDSTSSLTTGKMHFPGDRDREFSIDLAIVTMNTGGTWERLIHEKTGFVFSDKYYWNEARNSKSIREKADRLKKRGCWNEVREYYLRKKNGYLRKNDQNHPSFVCYIEAVNDVYAHYF